MKKATEDATLAMIMNPSGSVTYIPDAVGSKNIRVVVEEAVGFTTLAGLQFTHTATQPLPHIYFP